MSDPVKPTPPAPAPVGVPEPTASVGAAGAGTGAGAAGGQGSILDKARDLAKPYIDNARPYVEKAQAASKPYTDAAYAKGKEWKESWDTKPAAGTEAGGPDAVSRVGLGEGAAAAPPTQQQDLSQRAKGMFDYGVGSLKSGWTQLGATIDSQTATADKPGLFSQAGAALESARLAVDKQLGTTPVTDATGATGAAGAGAAHTPSAPAAASGYAVGGTAAAPASAPAAAAATPAADVSPASAGTKPSA
ncbi:uncharacterized protein LOC62_01G000696 [Vanrija pseudolonga]|uniref:Uncharacterized protein n=1 Tax=Vanrija pseudolonga TaxID=143232 RepID=A0AAF0XZX4_9TREE|nr:hypothetical protein LOC62_01G000696 [Vanrija pseudolonga]